MFTAQQIETTNTRTAMDPKTRVLLMAVRQALLMVLGAIEEYLDLPRSVVPKHQRN